MNKWLALSKNVVQRFFKQDEGQQGEKNAALYLKKQGLKIVAKNVNCKVGEIDLIALDGQTLVFVEVRVRNSEQYGGAGASVTKTKQQKIIKAAKWYLLNHYRGQPQPVCRFDVIAINHHTDSIKWLKQAFLSYGI